jgi:hypothetical protein
MKKIGSILIFSVIPFLGITAPHSWELEKNDDGIKVYTRTVEGQPIKEFKAITSIKANHLAIKKVILNVGGYVNWYPDVVEAKVVKRKSATEVIAYTRLDVPWPASDRDVVSSISSSSTTNSSKVILKSASGYVSKKDGIVRIPYTSGFWKLTTTKGVTEVHFQYIGNPGGSLPDWIINMFIVDSPYQTLINLKAKF